MSFFVWDTSSDSRLMEGQRRSLQPAKKEKDRKRRRLPKQDNLESNLDNSEETWQQHRSLKFAGHSTLSTVDGKCADILDRRSSESDHDKNVLYLTVVTPDIEKPQIDIQPKSLKISGKDTHGKEYALDLELYAEIDPAASKQRHTGLNLFFILQKKEDQAEFWPRLTSSKAKQHNIRTDFDKWVDEDEQDEAPELRKLLTSDAKSN
jgi:hypothetical protein